MEWSRGSATLVRGHFGGDSRPQFLADHRAVCLPAELPHRDAHEGGQRPFPAFADHRRVRRQNRVEGRVEFRLRHRRQPCRLGGGPRVRPVPRHRAQEARDRLLRERAVREHAEELAQVLEGDRVDVDAFASDLREVVREGVGGDLRLPGLSDDRFESVVQAILDELPGLLAGLFSIPTGVLLSAILVYVINVRSFGWSIQMELDPRFFVQAMGVAIGAALIAVVYPTRRLLRRPIAAALRQE